MDLVRPIRNRGLAGMLLTVGFLPMWALVARSAEKTPEGADLAKAAAFETRAEPILRARCLKCHGEERKVKGNLRLDSREAILRGGDQGPAATLDRPEESLILQAIRYDGLEMPPA